MSQHREPNGEIASDAREAGRLATAKNCSGCCRPLTSCTCNGHDYSDRGAHCTCNDEAASDLAAERAAHAETRTRLAAYERVVKAARRLAAAADACDKEAERHPSSRSSAPVVRSIKAMSDMRDALAALDGKGAER